MANPPEEPQSQQAHLKEAPTRSSADPLPLGNSISASPFRNGSPAPNHSAPATGVPLTASSSTTPGSLPNADAAPGAVNLPVRGTAPQDERFMLLSEIKCLRYANTMTRRNLKIPRRIDLVPQARIDITEHVTFDRKSNLDELWAPFGLAAHERKAIFAQLKAYFKKNPSEQVGSAKNSNKKTGAENKALLGELAYRLLVLEGWGVKYFGEQVNGALPRELTWPKESTSNLAFTMLLSVVLPNGTCHPLATSTTSFRPSSAHNPYFVDTPAQSPISMPSPVAAAAPVPTRNFFMNLAQQAGQSKKRKYDELAVETSEARTCEVELPVDANMIYFVSVRDKSNGISVGEAQSFRHTSSLGENSAFAHLKASFEATGYQPLIEMGTPSGWRPIIDAHDWDTAVLGIYNHGQRNVVVDVYI
ncbi:hypothetical protein QBC43DRAFT_212958 [Cladorrhinum sp. PSN259]|nr:hypothetical protein QBC43DRAFT_212958 [Cladorrhinum sp. PSN259]